jgi:hypothetical protein
MKVAATYVFIIPFLLFIFAIPSNLISAKDIKKEKEFNSSKDLVMNATNNKIHSIYINESLEKKGLCEDVFRMGYDGFNKLRNDGKINSDSILSVIDFSKPSNEKRLFVIDLKSGKLLYHSVVAHGKNTGEKYARVFSNKLNSHMSSIGFYVTKKTYNGGNGYSLQLEGLEKGFNDNAMKRAVVVHGADYAEESIISTKGYLGRSYGCPALPKEISKQVIDKIKDGNIVFAYYPDENYLKHSSILN